MVEFFTEQGQENCLETVNAKYNRLQQYISKIQSLLKCYSFPFMPSYLLATCSLKAYFNFDKILNGC